MRLLETTADIRWGFLGRGRQTTLEFVDDGYFWRFIGGYVFENFRDTASNNM